METLTFRACVCLAHQFHLTYCTLLWPSVFPFICFKPNIWLLWVVPVNCHLISRYTPHQFFLVSVRPHCKGWNTTSATDGKWYTSSRDMEYPGTAWAEYVAQVCKAGLQFLSESNSRTWEQRTLALAGWDRVEGLGPGQYLRSIDTHLQFLHTPTHTLSPLTTVSYIQECILPCAVSLPLCLTVTLPLSEPLTRFL